MPVYFPRKRMCGLRRLPPANRRRHPSLSWLSQLNTTAGKWTADDQSQYGRVEGDDATDQLMASHALYNA